MKQITIKLIMVSFLCCSVTYAQELNDTPTKHHEIALDVLEIIHLNRIEFSYDYLLNKSNSIGAKIGFGLNNEKLQKSQRFHEDFNLELNYKHFFSKKYAQGFYLKALTEYTHGKSFMEKNYDPKDFKKFSELDIGGGLGYKYVFRNNFFIDANIDLSGNIVNSLKSNSDYYLPKAKLFIGISIGKRF